MCRNIKTLFNFEPPATDEAIRASSLQFVSKLSGFNKPSKINEAAFDLAVEQVNEAAQSRSVFENNRSSQRSRIIARKGNSRVGNQSWGFRTLCEAGGMLDIKYRPAEAGAL
jgi:hypothetical protein